MDVSNTRSRNTLTKEQALERLLTELDDAVVPSKRTPYNTDDLRFRFGIWKSHI